MGDRLKTQQNIYPEASRGVLADRSDRPLDPPSKITKQRVVKDHFFLLFLIGLIIPLIGVIIGFLLFAFMLVSFFGGGNTLWASLGLALIFGPLIFVAVWFLLTFAISLLEVESPGKIAYAVTAFYGGLLLIAHGASKAIDGSIGSIDRPLGYSPFNFLFLLTFIIGSASLPTFVALNEHRFQSLRVSAANLCILSSALMLVGIILFRFY